MGVRVPEIEHQLVFVVEEGRAFPAGQALSGGLRASLFLQPGHLRAVAIPGTIREAVGASLRPTALRLLLPRGAPDFSGAERVPLEDLCGVRGRALLEQLMSADGPAQRVGVLRQQLSDLALVGPRTNAVARHSLELLTGGAPALSIEGLAKRCGVSTRALYKHVTVETGLTPKQVGRLIRLRRALAQMGDGTESLSAISAANEFADQAHMSREFRALLAKSPSALRQSLSAHRSLPPFVTERDLLGTGLLILPSGPLP